MIQVTDSLSTSPDSQEGVDPVFAAKFPNLYIDRLVARGGMGEVYQAVQTQLDRPVALKILPDEFAQDEVRRNLFVREAKAMARLSHPHLVQLFDFGESDGHWFMVQEWVPGQTLFDHLQAGIPFIDEGVQLVRDVCSGLQHAHENDVVHRDIKPANILVDEEGSIKLTDFGLAQSVGGRADDADEDEGAFGTPEYAAPELFVVGAQIDHRADIFAVGVLLYEVLTGQCPGDEFVPASELVDDMGTHFDPIIAKAMQADPEHRYQSCAELDQDLYDALEKHNVKPRVRTIANSGGSVLAKPTTLGSTRVSDLASAKGGGGGSIWGVLAGVAAIVAGGWYLFGNSAEDQKEDQSPPIVTTQTVDPSTHTPAATLPPQSSQQNTSLPEQDTAKDEPFVPSIDITPVKKPKHTGPVQELVTLKQSVKKRAAQALKTYDKEVKSLSGKYLDACVRKARDAKGAQRTFWEQEATFFKENKQPSDNDEGIPPYALRLREGWRDRRDRAAEPLKRIHLDITERIELMGNDFERRGEFRQANKVNREGSNLRTFSDFLSFLRQ